MTFKGPFQPKPFYDSMTDSPKSQEDAALGTRGQVCSQLFSLSPPDLSPSFGHEDVPRRDRDKEAPPRLPPSLGLPATRTAAISAPPEMARSLSALARMIHPQTQRHRALRSACCKILRLGDCLAQSHFGPGLLDSGDSPRANPPATTSWL